MVAPEIPAKGHTTQHMTDAPYGAAAPSAAVVI